IAWIWLWSLLTFLSCLVPGSSSQSVLTQTPAVSVSPGENVRLACTMSSGYSIASYRVEWYQQKPGSAPRFVYHYYTCSDQGRGTGIPTRFTVFPDTSNNLWNLVISGVQAEDEADYYCATWDGSSKTYHSDMVRQRTETKTVPHSQSACAHVKARP
uniref:Ig-like domain-containing protein n=1 Tax=Gopherus evgoodei TaxID=1825980 RepID=A0A8C4WS38_9SAUR